MGLTVKAVERVTRECVLEIPPSEVLDLLKRCKEVPRWAADRFQVTGGMVTVRWTEDVEQAQQSAPEPPVTDPLHPEYTPEGAADTEGF